jgi:hypothetical protein
MNRLGITVIAAVVGAVPAVGPIATADSAASTSPGVPCLDLVQEMAASPFVIQQPLENAAATLIDVVGAVPSPPAPVAPVPVVPAAAPVVPAAAPVVPAAAPVVPAGSPVVPAAAPVGGLPGPPIPTGPLPGPPPAAVEAAAVEAAPVEAAPIIEAAADASAPVADVAVGAAPIADAQVAAAPIADAAGVAAPIADAAGVVPPAPVFPDIGNLGSFVPAALPVPSVPGLPVPLPQTVSLPHDLICEGTAWSASKSNAHPPTVGRALANRRDW